MKGKTKTKDKNKYCTDQKHYLFKPDKVNVVSVTD